MKKLYLSAVLCATSLFGQPPVKPVPGSPLAPSATLSQPALYRAFFRHVQALENASSQLEQQGRNSAEMRSYYKAVIGLTDSQLLILKSEAASCNRAVAQQNQRAQQVIDEARALNAGKKILSKDDVPPPPTELVALEQGRTSISNSCIQDLRNSLGPQTFAKVDTWIRTKFAPHVTAASIVAHPPDGKVILPVFTSGSEVAQ